MITSALAHSAAAAIHCGPAGATPGPPRPCRDAQLLGANAQVGRASPTRRALLSQGLALSLAATAASALMPSAATAFGNGFPGYDINLDGRKRALDRNKREMEAELEKAAAFRAARTAAKEAAAKEAAAKEAAKAAAPP